MLADDIQPDTSADQMDRHFVNGGLQVNVTVHAPDVPALCAELQKLMANNPHCQFHIALVSKPEPARRSRRHGEHDLPEELR